MQIVVLTNDRLKEELLADHTPAAEVRWIDTPDALAQYPDADACIDLLFDNSEDRLQRLRSLSRATVIVNSVEKLDEAASHQLVRFAGWPTFLRGQLVEASGPESLQTAAGQVFAAFGRTIEWVPDEDGLVTPRVVSMIIGEAYRALEEGVSTKADIDTAMKLGTNYPYGPFEWAELIGVGSIRSLLRRMGEKNAKYLPVSSL